MDRETSRSPKAHLELQGPRPYVPRDVFDDATKSAIVGGLTGLFAAGVRNALSRENVGVSGMVTRQAPLIGILTVAPTVYSFVNGATQNLLGRNDAWGAVLGGFSAGCILGMPFRRFPTMMAVGAAMGISQGAFVVLGGRLESFKEENDEFERKEILRRTTRVPIEDTIKDLGEQSRIRAPGFEERRRESLREKYGIEVNPVSATTEGSQ